MSPPKKQDMPFGLPLTISAGKVLEHEDRAANKQQRRGGVVNFAALTKVEPSAQQGDAQGRPPTKRELEDQVRRDSYRVGDPTPTTVDLRKADLPGFMRLEASQIKTYDHNPRIFKNEKREDIKASLLAHGHQDAFVVTRRGPGEPYMLAAGSNTTLELVQEIFAETGDERFRWVACIYQEYEDETRLLAQHLGENLNRGDMKFWEQAKAMLELASRIEQQEIAAGQRAKPMSTREIAAALNALGLRADKTTVPTWQFAMERLAPLGPATARLKHRGVRDIIKPRLMQLGRLAELLGLAESDFWSTLVTPTLRTHGERLLAEEVPDLDPQAVVEDVQTALCERFDEQPSSVRSMLHALGLNPSATLAELRAPSPNLLSAGAPPDLPPADEDPGAEPPAQSPLALPPSLVQSQSRAPSPPSAGRDSTSSGTPRVSSGAASGPTAAAQQPLLPTAVEPTPTSALDALHQGLRTLVDLAGLADTLCLDARMPLAFFVDLPDPALHRSVPVRMNSDEDFQRQAKSLVWWTLSLLSGQWTNGAGELLDTSSRFYIHYAQDQTHSPFTGLDIEPQEPGYAAALLVRAQPAAVQPTMQALRRVEDLAGLVYQQHPDRWALMTRLQASDSPY